MQDGQSDAVYEDLDPGDEPVASSECWEDDELDDTSEGVYSDLTQHDEPVTSNECYDVEDE
jgi:hypothetical protein